MHEELGTKRFLSPFATPLCVDFQASLAQLESEAEELKAAEQAAKTRTENVTGKLKELIPRYKVPACLVCKWEGGVGDTSIYKMCQCVRSGCFCLRRPLFVELFSTFRFLKMMTTVE